jgi:hypothetical protein
MSKKEEKAKELKPWDRRPWPISGDTNQNELYAAVGRALSEWERYESVLAFLFANLIGAPVMLAARRAYSAVRTFEGRADMLRAASEAYFYGDPTATDRFQPDFKTILSHATSFASRRNDVAHGVVDHYRPKPPAPAPLPAPEEYALFPAYATFKDRDPESVPSYCYTSDELEYFRLEFFKLRKPAYDLSAEISVMVRKNASRGKLRWLYQESANQEAGQSDQKE